MIQDIFLLNFIKLIHLKVILAYFTKECTSFTKFQKMKLHHVLTNKCSTFLNTSNKFFIALFKMYQGLRIFIDILASTIVTFKFKFEQKILFISC